MTQRRKSILPIHSEQMLLAIGPAKLEGLAGVREYFLPLLGFVVFYSDPSPKDRDGSGVCLVGELKMLSLLLVDLMNGLWELKPPSALAGSLSAFLPWPSVGQMYRPVMGAVSTFVLSEKLVPSRCHVLITQ